MPAHSFLISPAQGLPACCATATEPDSSSSAVNIACPDRIPAILDSSDRIAKCGYRRKSCCYSLHNPRLDVSATKSLKNRGRVYLLRASCHRDVDASQGGL